MPNVIELKHQILQLLRLRNFVRRLNPKEEVISTDDLIGFMTGAFIGALLLPTLLDIIHNDEPEIWITSPGGVKYPFPMFQARRIVKKRNWSYTDVAPIRTISRWEGIKIALKGDRHLK